MKLIPLIFLILSSCSACGGKLDIDPKLEPYFTRFNREAMKLGITPNLDSGLEMKFGDTSHGSDVYLGYCETNPLTHPVITISNQINWDSMGDTYKEELVYHELGHCVLHRSHNKNLWQPDSNSSYSIPESIMIPGMSNYVAYANYHDHYIRELFTGRD